MADKRGPTVSLKAFSPASGCVLACIRRWDHEVAMAGHGECVTVTGRIREHGTLREAFGDFGAAGRGDGTKQQPGVRNGHMGRASQDTKQNSMRRLWEITGDRREIAPKNGGLGLPVGAQNFSFPFLPGLKRRELNVFHVIDETDASVTKLYVQNQT